MEWVETTAKTVEEAKDIALDQLGVAEDDAEFEVIEEPRAGLFGRVRGSARVRARVRPTQPRPKLDRRDRRRRSDGAAKPARPAGSTEALESEAGPKVATAPRSGRPRRPAGTRVAGTDDTEGAAALVEPAGDGGHVIDDATHEATRNRTSVNGDSASSAPRRRRSGNGTAAGASGDATAQREEQQMGEVEAAQVGQEAVRFVDGLLTAFGLAGTIELITDGDELEVRVSGDNLGLLVGPRGTTLQAVQDLTRVAAQRRLGDRETRLRVDVGGYRERRREALTRFAQQIADDVVSSGRARALEPMSSADRKVIHDVLTTVDAVVTHSEGDDPNRRVIIAPANA